MRIRRCKVIYMEPREHVGFDLGSLLSGGDGVDRRLAWMALLPHMGNEVELDGDAWRLLGRLGTERWIPAEELAPAEVPALGALLEAGAVVADDPGYALQKSRDDALRGNHWHPLSALLHGMTRWDGVDTVDAMRKTGTETAGELRGLLGAPPPEHASPALAGPVIAMERPVAGDFDRLLRRRTTCRNFELSRALPLSMLSQLMDRVFAAQGTVHVSDDTVFLKKNSPSGGGLHPVEAYLLVRNVEGLEGGLYHYDPLAHALGRLAEPATPLDALALQAVAGQTWFAEAHVLAIMAPRYGRNFWKYRQHAKAYRAVLLEAGHLSQTLYLSATEAGLAAYVTCAINESCLDEALGLDPMNEGVLAVCGFGWRGETMETMELDPLGTIWQL